MLLASGGIIKKNKLKKFFELAIPTTQCEANEWIIAACSVIPDLMADHRAMRKALEFYENKRWAQTSVSECPDICITQHDDLGADARKTLAALRCKDE